MHIHNIEIINYLLYIMFSVSNYKIITQEDTSEKITYELYNSATGRTTHEKNKYNIVKVIRTEDESIIYEYKKANTSTKQFNGFIKIRGEEWWFDSIDYTKRLFVNCDTGEVYNETENNCGFIWTGPCKISPGGKYMLMIGCIWACPYETRLYDISNLINGYEEIDIYDNIVDQEKDECLYDDFDYKFEFVSDNEITIYKYQGIGKDFVYYNTINL